MKILTIGILLLLSFQSSAGEHIMFPVVSNLNWDDRTVVSQGQTLELDEQANSVGLGYTYISSSGLTAGAEGMIYVRDGRVLDPPSSDGGYTQSFILLGKVGYIFNGHDWIKPYIETGIGLNFHRINGSREHASVYGFGTHYGAGLNFQIIDWLGLRLGVNNLQFHAADGRGNHMDNDILKYSLGVFINFSQL